MGKVYANGRELLSKGDHGKISAAFPDVCNSPPSPPTGPVPVPYAASSSAGSLKAATKRVKIGGQGVGVRDQSYLASSPLGNEAATKALGGNLVTHQITGKTYFGSWSLDVEAEGKGVLRHLDLTTSNHGSYPGGTPPFPNLSSVHQLALSRVAAKQCPCCGEKSCPAAFKAGEEPLTMREAIGADPRRDNYSSARAEDLALLRNVKKTECYCDKPVFPSPPCDVYRTPDSGRHKKIEAAWDAYRDHYKKWYKKAYGAALQGWPHFFQIMMATVPAATQAKMRQSDRLPSAQRKQIPEWKQMKKMEIAARKTERINHLTPKEAGGCPTNHNNLQPQQAMCDWCQDIDDFMTDCFQQKEKK